jgi:hypothetical protein
MGYVQGAMLSPASVSITMSRAGISGASPKERCLAVFRNYPPELLDMITRTYPRVVTEHGYYTHDVSAMRGVGG